LTPAAAQSIIDVAAPGIVPGRRRRRRRWDTPDVVGADNGINSMTRRHPMRGVQCVVRLAAAVVVGLGVVRIAMAADVADWPCQQPMTGKLSVRDLGDGLPAAPADDWRADARVSDVVKDATDPEYPAAHGAAEIESFARAVGADRDHAMALVLAGIVDETNNLRAILIDGIRDNVIRAKMLSDVVAENEAALAAISEAGSDADAKNREDIAQAKFWNVRSLNKAKDDAEFLCHRLAYLDKKTHQLADAIRTESQGQ
jgi:hypothetical protein